MITAGAADTVIKRVRFFTAIVISGEVGIRKPDPRIFHLALQRTGLQPEEVVYVGDTEEDIAGALGMHPWRCKTFFMPLVQRHKMRDLVSHMTRLRKLDADVKGAARSKRTLVELAVLAIAQ
jgi:FMN phosphatase YigB (HAD superfamily)